MSKGIQSSLSKRLALTALLIGGSILGAYAALGPQFLRGFWLQIALLTIAGLALAPGLLQTPESLLFGILAFSLSFSARWRVLSPEMHQGGAEAAIAPLDFPLLGLAVFYLLRDIRSGTIRWPWQSLETAILVFGVSALPSLLVAPKPFFGAYELCRLVRVLLLLGCVKRFLRSEPSARFAIWIVLLMVLVQAGLGIAQLTLDRTVGLDILGEVDQVWRDPTIGEGVSRIGGTLGHANNLASFLVLLLPLSLSLFWSDSLPFRMRWVNLVVLGLGLVTMIFTFSRGGWAALALGFVLVTLLQLRVIGRSSKRHSLAVVTGTVVCLALIVPFWNTIYLRFTASSPYSLIFRRNLAEIAVNMLRARPVIGTGLNNFVFNIPQYDTIGFAHRDLPVHNLYLLVAAETGILGFAAFSWLLLAVLRICWPAATVGRGFVASSARGLFGGICAILAQGVLGWGWRFDATHMLFWFVVGLVASLQRLLKNAEFAPGR